MRRRGADVVHTEATEQRLGKTRSDAPGTGGVNVGAGEGVEKGVMEAAYSRCGYNWRRRR
jgi:hypothetical protein